MHHAFAHHAMSSAGGSWFMHTLLSAFVHTAVYHMVAPLFHFGIVGNILVGIVMIAIVGFISKRIFA